MKRLLLMSVTLIGAMTVMAQSIKGPDAITYFQAPATGVKFAKADVYIKHDNVLEQAKLDEQKEKNSAMGAKFGALGTAVANTANAGLTMLKKLENATKEFQDEKGRFAVWNFVPNYIIAKPENNNAVIVEVFVLNEPDPSPGTRMPTTADKDGYYDVPYYINCRYKISDPRGNLIHEDNLGVLSGTQKTKNYTPPKPAQPGITVTVEESDELTASERIGINKAYNRVRQEVFANYGFGQFSAPIKLGVVNEIKASKKLIKPTLAIFENKQGLLLSKDEKAKVQEFVDILEAGLASTSDKTRWVAYHNLSVCYAWLENPEKAKDAYTKYAAEIKETLDKMDCWNKILQGKMKAKEMKEKTGSTFIGMKDQKKYEQYNNIKCFVNNYAAGAKRYEKLFSVINRDLAKFVDYYAHNDLMCQLFEIDYPFQFLPLNDFYGAPKAMEGTLSKDGVDPIEFQVKFDSKRRIKELTADQSMKTEDGKTERLKTREIKPQYNDNGEYTTIITDAGSWQRSVGSNSYFYKLNSVYDPLSEKTFGKAGNITKAAGFLGDRQSSEGVQLKVDLDGNITFTGEADYFKMNALFKEMLMANGIEYKRADTKAKFTTKANINEQGVMTFWSWDGNVKTDFAGFLSARTQKVTADKMLREIKFTDIDDKGNPVKVEYSFNTKGKLVVEGKVSSKEYFANYAKNNGAINGKISAEGFDITNKSTWECQFTYDAQGNWTEMKVGPYTAKRTFKY